MSASSSRLAAKATVSVSAPDSGSSVRLKPMFRTIERRAATALIALTMVVVKS